MRTAVLCALLSPGVKDAIGLQLPLSMAVLPQWFIIDNTTVAYSVCLQVEDGYCKESLFGNKYFAPEEMFGLSVNKLMDCNLHLYSVENVICNGMMQR